MKRFTPPDRSLRVGFFSDPRLVCLKIGGAPEQMRGLRALFVSDVHLRRQVDDDALNRLIDQMNGARADLLLLGGDYAETPDQCARFFAALKRLKFPLGAYGVCGNNDYCCASTLRNTMADAGVYLLLNEVRALDLPGGRLSLGGCDDHKYGFPRTEYLFPQDAGYRLLLSHFPVRPDCRCELMLSGHTHAGQCNFLGLTPYSLGFEHRYRLLSVRGWGRAGEMDYLVGNGVGMSRVPLRLGAQPQIYLLEFSQ